MRGPTVIGSPNSRWPRADPCGLGPLDRGTLTVDREPHGDWLDTPEREATIRAAPDLGHVVDGFREPPDEETIVTTRRHG